MGRCRSRSASFAGVTPWTRPGGPSAASAARCRIWPAGPKAATVLPRNPWTSRTTTNLTLNPKSESKSEIFNLKSAISKLHGRHSIDRRQPHGQEVRAADPGWHHPGDGFAPDQGKAGRLRPDDLRPGVHEYRELPQRHHLHRR